MHTRDDDDRPAPADGSGTGGTGTGGWEQRYADGGPLWSGRVNAAVADALDAVAPGLALDVGCGEGGDAVWLARHGWHVTGIDLSATAVRRAQAAATAAGAQATRFAVADVRGWTGGRDGGYDLVCCAFLHTHGGQDRAEPLRAAAAQVAPGGRLLVVSHAVMPPWAPHHDDPAITPDGDFLLLRLGESWAVERAEVRPRDADGPDGRHAVLRDSVLLVRRAG